MKAKKIKMQLQLAKKEKTEIEFNKQKFRPRSS